MAKHVFVQKEKHKSTGTTLLHDNDSIELSVSSPCSSAEPQLSPSNARRIIMQDYCCGERDRSSCFSSRSSKKESKASFPKTVRGLFQRKERCHFPSSAPSSPPCEECTTTSTRSSTTEQNFSRRSLRRRNGHKCGSGRRGDGSSSHGHVEHETVVVYPKVRRPSLQIKNMPDRFRKEQPISSRSVSERDTENNDSIPPFVLPVGSSSSSSEHNQFVEANTPLHSNKTIHFHSFSLGNDSQTDTNSISKMEDPPQETYFSMTDFAKHNWVETIMSNSSTTESLSSLGFLSIMAATVVIHPMLFVTGAATAVWAVGVVHAVEKGYEFFTDGQFQNIFWADAGEEATAAVDSRGGEEEEDAENAHEENSRSSHTSNRPQHLQQQKQRHSSPTTTRSTDDSILSSSPFLTLPPSPPLPATPHHSSQYKHPTSQDPSILAHFPPLENQLVTAEFPGLNALEFFHVFFSDHAPYSWKEFQQSIGDVDIEFGTWNKLEQPPNPSTTFHPYVQLDSLPHYPLPSCSKKERICTFKTLTKSYFGPAYASARKIQRVSKFSTRLVILENKTELFDIPFSDRFFVLERWTIESTKHDANFHPSNNTAMKYTTRLSVSVQVFMRKPCNWEKQIRSKTLSTMTDLVTTWSEKATQALDLTLRRKLERMRVRYETHNGKSLYSFQSQTTHQDANNLKSPSDGSVSSRTLSSLSFLSNNRLTKSRGASMKNKMPETSEQELMRMHQKQLKLLEEKIASGDLEWCSIETKHCLSAGKGLAFARVLDQERNMLMTSPSLSPKKANCNDTKKRGGKRSDKTFKKWAINNGVKGLVLSDDKRTSVADVKGLGSVKKRLILRRKSDAAT